MEEEVITRQNSFNIELQTEKINSYSITFDMINNIEIRAHQIKSHFPKSYYKEYTITEIMENNLMQNDDLNDIFNEIKDKIFNNKIIMKENENSLIINIPFPSSKNKEIKFELNLIHKNNNEKINELIEIVIKQDKEINDLKKEINELKNDKIQFKNEITQLIKNEIEKYKNELIEMKNNENQLKNEINELKSEVIKYKNNEYQLKDEPINIKKDEQRIKNDEQKLKNNNHKDVLKNNEPHENKEIKPPKKTGINKYLKRVKKYLDSEEGQKKIYPMRKKLTSHSENKNIRNKYLNKNNENFDDNNLNNLYIYEKIMNRNYIDEYFHNIDLHYKKEGNYNNNK